MLAVAIGSQRLTSASRFLRTHAETTRRVAGLVLGATALAIALGADQRFTTALPGYTQAFQNRVERSSVATRALEDLSNNGGPLTASEAASREPMAPGFRDLSDWLNTPSGKALSITGLRGRVVARGLLDVLLHQLPAHAAASGGLDRAYRKDGLTIVGVHTPEFAFEHVPSNVRSAVHRLGIRYPVAQDNGYATWTAYRNNFWPADYLIDRAGRIRFTHFGEGAYGETENQIRGLLGEKRGKRTNIADATPRELTTPESYLGYQRLERFAGQIAYDDPARYRFPPRLAQDELAYAGQWTVQPTRIVAGNDARLRLRFEAEDVYLVLGGHGRVATFVDGHPTGTVDVSGTPRLYTLEHYPTLTRALLELRASPGVEAYAFTFG